MEQPYTGSQWDLLNRLSHEMRTPLSAILGFAQLMESGTPAPTLAQKRGLELILQGAWHLEKLIDMTRDLALILSGQLELSLSSVSLPSVMLEVQSLINPQVLMRNVRVLTPDFHSPCFVLADRNRLQQVLGHLLSAAVDDGQPDRRVLVSCDIHLAEWIRFSVTNDSDGLAPEEPTAATSETTRISLLLATRLVELMGGTMGPKCHVGVTRAFSFDLKRTATPTVVDPTPPCYASPGRVAHTLPR